MLDLNIGVSPYNDLFPNVEMIKSVNAPVFILHGAKDEEVPLEHSKLLVENVKNLVIMWTAPGCGHNDIDLKQPEEYFKNLFAFLKAVEKQQRAKKPEELLLANQANPWDKNFKHLYKKGLKTQKPAFSHHSSFNELQVPGSRKNLSSIDKSLSSFKSSQKNSSNSNEIIEKKFHSGSSYHSKSPSFVEFASRNNSSSVMVAPKILMPKAKKTADIKESSQEMEEEKKNP